MQRRLPRLRRPPLSDSSPQSWGTSCFPCPTVPNGYATCSTGSCGAACYSGYHACSGVCVSDSSPQSCGTSCFPCPTVADGYATCSYGTCGFGCNDGYTRCGAACAANLATEPCNGVDDDCDGVLDEGCGSGNRASPIRVDPAGGVYHRQISGSSTTSGSCNAYASGGVERVCAWTPARSGTATVNITTDYWPASLYVRQGTCKEPAHRVGTDERLGRQPNFRQAGRAQRALVPGQPAERTGQRAAQREPPVVQP